MKKLILSIAVLFGAVTMNAQEVGQMWVGGQVGFDYNKPKDGDSNTSYKILPEIGYQFQENLGIGIRLGYAHDETSFVSNSRMSDLLGGKGSEINMFKVNPYVRYTIVKGSVGSLFIDGGAAYAHGKDKNKDLKADQIEVGFRPGVAINVSDKVALTGQFAFLGWQYEKLGDMKNNRIALDLDMSQVLLGVLVKF